MNKIILERLRSELLERKSLDLLPEAVWKRNAALNTWGTNAIEGSTITREDAEKILLDGRSVGNRPTRDVIETVQHERAFRGLIERRKEEINLETILELHEEVFNNILNDAGRWRRTNVRVRGAEFTPPRMEKVVREVEDWEEEYRQRDLRGEDVFSLGAWMHFEFERIHPFSDGNGRVGRLLLNLHFLKKNWPPVHILPEHRDKYLNSLNEAATGDFTILEDFLRARMGSSLVDLLDQVGTEKDELISLKEVSSQAPYDNRYLALRCKQGELPSLKEGREWRTSRRALEIYIEETGRK